ncbi:hypothetical protein AQ853_24300 [Burkholderia pseudomallei]|nr:hypothetical protein AQ853_24300 [Burkholderia pseudomallei]
MLFAKLAQSRRAALFTQFEEGFQVEAELTLALFDDRSQCNEIDEMLSLVVGNAAPKPFAGLFGEDPRVQAVFPFVLLPGDDIAVPVGQHGQKAGVFDPFRVEERGGTSDRIRQPLAFESQFLEVPFQKVAVIGQQRFFAGVRTAHGLKRYSGCKRFEESTVAQRAKRS